jgi:signal transduction histidine kinase
MKINKIHLILIIFLVFTSNLSLALSQLQQNADYEIEVTQITVNNEQMAPQKGAIVIASTDSLSIDYKLVEPVNAKKTDFFYRLTLTNGNDTATSNSGFPTAKYNNLMEGRYFIIISAFAIRQKWEVKPYKLQIIVDNKLAELWKKNKEIEKKLLAKQKQLLNQNRKNENFYTHLAEFLQTPTGLALLIVIIILISFFIFYMVYRKKINQIKKVQKLIEKRGKNMANSELAPITQEEYEKLIAENANLKAEMSSMKGQIDAMSVRSNELASRNKEMEAKIELLSKSKSDLEELSKQKDELFAIVIHDIKNPAAIIKNLVDLLRSYDLTANEQQEIIEDIAETTLKIVQLSQEVTKILTLESSMLMLNLEPSPIKYIIDDVITRNKPNAYRKKMSLFAEVDSNLPDLEIDSAKIDEVLDNLISNAIKFTQEGGSIRVKAYKELRDIIVEVSDNGLGLSEEDVAKAFRRGQKLSNKPTGGETSTGIGLWIVKKIIDAHHGKVWIKSVLGKGSTFAFSIPQKQFELKE